MQTFKFSFPGIAEPVVVLGKSGDRSIAVRECPRCQHRPPTAEYPAGLLDFYREPGGAGPPIGTWEYTCRAGCTKDLEVEYLGEVR